MKALDLPSLNFNDMMCHTTKYTEYRKGVLKASVKLIARKIHNNNYQEQLLCDSLENSRDLTMLLFNSDIIEYIDKMDGIPKIILTIVGKITESFTVEAHSNSNSNDITFGDNATVP